MIESFLEHFSAMRGIILLYAICILPCKIFQQAFFHLFRTFYKESFEYSSI